MRESRFFETALLMVRTIPAVAEERCFALKGGTAINMFVRDLPRLSVDIDLTYVPIEPRETSLENISRALRRIADRIASSIPRAKILKTVQKATDKVFKLTIREGDRQIKIEPNTILRGTVFPAVTRSLSKKAEELFEAAVSIQTLSVGDLYGGKFCAALDRQHPRDIFDMKLLLENEGITDEIRKAFVVYLSGHDRPIHELLQPSRENFKKVFETDFEQMSATAVTYDELVEVRERYIKLATSLLTKAEREFLITLKQGNPDWTLLELPGIEKLPSLQWKLTNVRKMDKKKREQMVAKLKSVLGF